MKYLILLLFLILLTSCTTTKYVIVPLSEPPTFFYPNTNIQTQKDLIKDYQNSLIKISEWQKWYNIQVNTNHF